MKNTRLIFYFFSFGLLLVAAPVSATVVVPAAGLQGTGIVVANIQRDVQHPIRKEPSQKPKTERRVARQWIWLGVFLLLAAGFFYLSLVSFLLVTTAETGTALFTVTRWIFLALGLGFLGWGFRKLVRALRKKQ